MITFQSEIERYEKMGEKTGWTFVHIPAEIALQIKPNNKKSFRVKGKLDNIEIEGHAFTPVGEGNFIMPLNSALRNKLKKQEGDTLYLQLEEHKDFKIEIPSDLELCLSDEPHLLTNFLKQPKSHQNYFINWLNSAKTEPTRTKRLVKIITAMDKKQDFSQMMRDKDS